MFLPIQNGKIISGTESFYWLQDAIKKCNSSFTICSAFLRSEALISLLNNLPTGIPGRILVRWRMEDLIAGASDLYSYEICRNNNIKLFMRLDFHGKVFMIPPVGILIGSANATSSGLGLIKNHNEETCTLIDFDEQNKNKIDNFFKRSLEIDDNLFKKITSAYENIPKREFKQDEWPADISNLFEIYNPVEKLLVSECFSCNLLNLDDVKFKNDCQLLGFTQLDGTATYDSDAINYEIKKTKIYKWLSYQLETNNNELYFGNLSSTLHSSLVDDPKNYRSDVKDLLQNLLSWVGKYCPNDIAIDRPNHSQRVRLLQKK